MGVTEGEIEGICVDGRQRTAWIDYVRRWTECGLPAARRTMLDRLCHEDKKYFYGPTRQIMQNVQCSLCAFVVYYFITCNLDRKAMPYTCT